MPGVRPASIRPIVFIICATDRLRTLVTIATYASRRLILGKLKIAVFLFHWRYLNFDFAEMLIE